MQPYAMTPAGPTGLAAGPFSHASYTVKRSFWSFFSREFRVYSPDGNLALFVKHPLFKMREEWSLYADEGATQPLVTVRTRQILALNFVYDVVDSRTGQQVGSIRNKGLKSILRDEWDLLGPGDQPVGLMQEDGFALLRRFFPLLLGRWHLEIGGATVASIAQRFRFFSKEFSLSIAPGSIDPRFAMACVMLALMREIRREDASHSSE
jgi:uncharacterized protein YxjI